MVVTNRDGMQQDATRSRYDKERQDKNENKDENITTLHGNTGTGS